MMDSLDNGLLTPLEPYPAYRASGVEWLVEIPAHWEVTRLGRISECLDGQRVPLNAEQRGGMQGEFPYWGANSIVDYIDRWLFDEELVLLGEDGAPFFDRNREVAFTVNGKVWVNNHAHVLRPRSQVHAPFLSSVLNCVDYAAFIDGTTRDKLTQGDMNVIPIQVPPLPEQRAIAAFLDLETAKIDSLVAKKERLIELLQEKRTALISRAVTKGLDPNMPMKDSGVKWLGEIPAHWDVKRLKHLLRAPLQYGANEPSNHIDPDSPRYIRITDIREDGTLWDETFRSIPQEIAQPYLLAEGDLLFARSGATVGKTFNYRPSWGKAAYAGYLVRARLDDHLTESDFVEYFTHSQEYKDWILGNLIQSTIQNVSAERYASLAVPLPPLVDQRAISKHLHSETAKLDALVAKVHEAIDCLRELRAALISAAVTGKIDVREEAA